jgi:hypothetical protein
MEAIAMTICRRRWSPSRLVAIADRLEKDVAASARRSTARQSRSDEMGGRI